MIFCRVKKQIYKVQHYCLIILIKIKTKKLVFPQKCLLKIKLQILENLHEPFLVHVVYNLNNQIRITFYPKILEKVKIQRTNIKFDTILKIFQVKL